MSTKTARRSSAKRPASKKGSSRSSKGSSRTPVRQHLSPWARDAAGIGLVVVAVLCMLGLWFASGGPFGTFVTFIGRGSMGIFAIALPLLLLFWGVVLILGKAEDSRVRMAVGFAMLVVGGLGLASILMGNPKVSSGFSGVEDAAGMIGALAAWPLSRVVSPLGAGIVCAGVAILGLLIFSGSSFSAVWEWLQRLGEQIREAAAAERPSRVEEGSEEEEDKPRRVVRTEDEDFVVDEPVPEPVPVVVVPDAGDPEDEDVAGDDLPEDEDDDPDLLEPAPRPRVPVAAYKLPPLDLLKTAPKSAADGMDEEHVMEALERTFETFGVPATVPMAHRGPTVTLYEVEVGAGTKVNKVLSLADDIAYALATPDVRIIAPIPGKSAIGVEVPNKHRDFVMLGDILRSKAAKETHHPLTVALGKDVQGRAHMVNLATMPHMLIAGATGAGKSSLVNCFVTSLLMRTTPEDVRLVLVDPKRVEMSHFADVPHLLSPIIVHPKRAAEALKWIVREMELRYEMLATVGVRDIDGYEEGLRAGTLRVPPGQDAKFDHLPFIVVVIDELADLMMIAPRDVEDAICRIAQMARAVGIHLIVATQRPSVDVVTGLIKANIPSRVALMTSSQADSRVILDTNGAEKLVGHGDMLFAPANASKATRLQGAWVTEEEIHGVTGFIREQREPVFDMTVEGLGKPPAEGGAAEVEAGSDDDLVEQATELVIRSQLGSTSMLQRKLKVGFARAGRLMDLLEERGVVGPSQGSKARDVLITPEEWEESRSRSA
ncbi:MAG: DNA translocase FtsK 4TM domain-containing protein [Actinomycetota bacterium]